MAVAGMLAGLGGAVESLGVDGRFEAGVNVGLGFEGITIALLARANPLGVIPAALLVGLMEAGASRMQFKAGVAPELIDVIQALILFFVAAPIIIRWVLRMRRQLRTAPTRSRLGCGHDTRQKQMLYVGAALIVVIAWTFYTADGPQTTAVLAGTVRAATLLVLGAMCGMIGERSGVVNIGIEGQFLLSAFAAFTSASMTGSLFLGTVAGVGMGLIMGWMLAAMAVGLKVDQIIAGTVLNIAALGLTSFFYDRSRSLGMGKYTNIDLGPLADIPLIAQIFQQTSVDLPHHGSTGGSSCRSFRSVWGMRTRAIGNTLGC